MVLFPDRIQTFFQKRIDASGLALFRMVYSAVLLAEVFQFYRFRELVFDNVPFLEPYELNMLYPLVLWMASLVCLIAGFQTRLAAVANYALTVAVIGTLVTFNYHVHLAYLGLNFLMILLPVGRVWSVDRLLLDRRWPDRQGDNSVNVFAYYLPLFMGLGLVYFDSIFYKFSSPMWVNGLGLWEPASLLFVTHNDTSWILNNLFLMKLLCYVTLIFETVFIFLFWFRQFRVPLLIIGLGLHIGILIEFPIPWFALTACALYILLVPVKWWRRLFGFQSTRAESDSYRGYDLLPDRQKAVVTWYSMILLFLFQIMLLYHSDPINLKSKIGLKDSAFDRAVKTATELPRLLGEQFLGLMAHPVFMDRYHFNNYNHIIHVSYLDRNTGREIPLPIMNKYGMPDKYLHGAIWVMWNWRVISQNVQMDKVNSGLERFTAFWAAENDISLRDADFLIKVKVIDIPTSWERDFLKNQKALPWQELGTIQWRENRFYSALPEIESIR